MDDEILEQIPSRTYRVSNGRIAGWIDDLDAVRQAIEKVLHTERFMWPIYTDNYGIEMQKMIGQDYDLILAEIERVITESLSVDERIIVVDQLNVVQQDKDILIVTFVVETIFGQLRMDQEVAI